MKLPDHKKIYFLSDFHLGAPNHAASLEREKLIVQFLSEIEYTAAAIFIVGDMFDFWYEYKYVVPKGYVRLLGKLAMLADKGIALYFFVGNHDMWMRTYLQEEIPMQVFYEPQKFVWNNKKFIIGHGDGLGPGDEGYKRLKKIFRNPVCQYLFGILPPQIGMGAANYMSRRSREKTGHSEEKFLGEEKEWLVTYCREVLQKEHVDYFIFGHRHLAMDIRLNAQSRYINLGDWLSFYTYAVYDGEDVSLLSYKNFTDKIYTNRS